MRALYIIVFILISVQVRGGLVFNEVMSNVKGTDSGVGAPGDRNEFIELYNLSDTSINILKYHISDLSANDYFALYPDSLVYPGGIINDSIVPTGKYIVILDAEYSDTGDSTNYMPYRIPHDAYVFTLSNTAFGESGLSTNDALYLLDENDSMIDSFGTPESEDDFPYDPGDGISLEKMNFRYSDSPLSYSPCTDTTGSTPGYVNSVFISGLVIDSVKAVPMDGLCSLFVYLNYDGNISDKLLMQCENRTDTLEIKENEILILIDNGIHKIVNLRTLSSAKTKTILTKKNYNPGTLLMNEFMVSGTEWIEIYNPHSIAFYMDGLYMVNSADTVIFEYDSIAGGGYVVLSKDTSEVRSEYYQLNLKLHQCELFALPDREDTFSFFLNDILLDSVIRGYENSSVSVERISSEISGYKKENWDDCIDFRGATPCMKNSISFVSLTETDSLAVYPEILTDADPNLFLTIKLSEYMGTVNVKLYDELGALIDYPIAERTVGSEETIFIKRLNSILKSGIYLMFVEIETPTRSFKRMLRFAVRNN